VDAGGAGLLRQARDARLHVLGGHHHEVGELVHDHHDVRQLLGHGVERVRRLVVVRVHEHFFAVDALRGDLAHAARLELARRQLARDHALHLAVEGDDVLGADIREELVAPLHLVHRPLERQRGLAHVGDHGQQHVRDAVEDRELDHLRVDHQHAHLFGRLLGQQRHQHDVEAHALAGAGGTRHQEVRHLAEVAVDGLARDVLAERDGQVALVFLPLAQLEDLAQRHGLPDGVGQLEAHARLAGDGRHDAHLLHRERHGEVVGQAADLADLGAALGLELVHGDHGTRVDLVHASLDLVGLERPHQQLGQPLQVCRILLHLFGGRLVQEVGPGQLELSAGRAHRGHALALDDLTAHVLGHHDLGGARGLRERALGRDGGGDERADHGHRGLVVLLDRAVVILDVGVGGQLERVERVICVLVLVEDLVVFFLVVVHHVGRAGGASTERGTSHARLVEVFVVPHRGEALVAGIGASGLCARRCTGRDHLGLQQRALRRVLFGLERFRLAPGLGHGADGVARATVALTHGGSQHARRIHHRDRRAQHQRDQQDRHAQHHGTREAEERPQHLAQHLADATPRQVTAEDLLAGHGQVQERTADEHDDERGRDGGGAQQATAPTEEAPRREAELDGEQPRRDTERGGERAGETGPDGAHEVVAARCVVRPERETHQQGPRGGEDAEHLVPPASGGRNGLAHRGGTGSRLGVRRCGCL
jgi:hypothetical protein